MFGDSGSDVLVGGAGDDLLDGGAGNDTMIGGLGKDSFVVGVESGGNQIIDYVDGNDSFVLIDGLSFDELSIVQGNYTTEITLNSNSQVLATVPLAFANEIGKEDFITSESFH